MKFIKKDLNQEFEIMLGSEKREIINTLINAIQQDNPKAMEIQIPVQAGKTYQAYAYHLPIVPELFSELADTEFKNVNEQLLYCTYERFGKSSLTGEPLQFTYFGIELLNPTKTQDLLPYAEYLLQYLVDHYLSPVQGIAAFEYEVSRDTKHNSEFLISHKDNLQLFIIGKQYKNHINLTIKIDKMLTLLQ